MIKSKFLKLQGAAKQALKIAEENYLSDVQIDEIDPQDKDVVIGDMSRAMLTIIDLLSDDSMFTYICKWCKDQDGGCLQCVDKKEAEPIDKAKCIIAGEIDSGRCNNCQQYNYSSGNPEFFPLVHLILHKGVTILQLLRTKGFIFHYKSPSESKRRSSASICIRMECRGIASSVRRVFSL